MGIVSAFYAGARGSIPGKVEMLSSVLVNHSLTGPRCKNGTSKCWEDLIWPPPPIVGLLKAVHVVNHLKVMAHTKVG